MCRPELLAVTAVWSAHGTTYLRMYNVYFQFATQCETKHDITFVHLMSPQARWGCVTYCLTIECGLTILCTAYISYCCTCYYIFLQNTSLPVHL